MTQSILAQLTALKRLSTVDLKAKYRELLGAEPNARNRSQIESRIAYRLQEIAFGGFRPDIVERLDALAAEAARPVARPAAERPTRGTRFIREYQGVKHVVTTMQDGFEWQGRPYRSLSSVARAITGTRWNGYLFFGLGGKARRGR